MKRVEAIRMLLGGAVEGVVVTVDRYGWEVSKLIKIYDYLDEEIPEAAPTACQPGKTVDVWEDPEPKRERKGGRASHVDTGKIVALRKAGWTLEQIAEELNVDKSTVSYHIAKLKEAGEI